MGRRCPRRGRLRVRRPFAIVVPRIAWRGWREVRRRPGHRVRRLPCLWGRGSVRVERRLHAVLVTGCRWWRRRCLRRGMCRGFLALLGCHGIQRIDGRCCDRHWVAVHCLRWSSGRARTGLRCLSDRSCWRKYIRHCGGMHRGHAGRMDRGCVRRRVHSVGIASGSEWLGRERARRRRLYSRQRSD